jgi:hypothetical protein
MIYFSLGLIVSIIYSYYCLPKNEGGEPSISITLYPILYKGMIYIPVGFDKYLHIHHWLCYLGLLGFYSYLPSYINGFFIGMCVHGLTYNDSLVFLEMSPYIN